MEAFIKINNPDDVECSITLTMKLALWKKLCTQLKTDWPSGNLNRVIYDLIEKAGTKFTSEEKIEM